MTYESKRVVRPQRYLLTSWLMNGDSDNAPSPSPPVIPVNKITDRHYLIPLLIHLHIYRPSIPGVGCWQKPYISSKNVCVSFPIPGQSRQLKYIASSGREATGPRLIEHKRYELITVYECGTFVIVIATNKFIWKSMDTPVQWSNHWTRFISSVTP